MDYVSKWVEVVASPTNDYKVVVNFLRKNIFTGFGVSKVDGGKHFHNQQLQFVLTKYGVTHKIVTLYHPQTIG